jgi:FAD dependent oxidoreductase
VVEQLLVAGRCISADHGAHGRSRNVPACMATGQAASIAASIAVGSNTTVRHIPTENLQSCESFPRSGGGFEEAKAEEEEKGKGIIGSCCRDCLCDDQRERHRLAHSGVILLYTNHTNSA